MIALDTNQTITIIEGKTKIIVPKISIESQIPTKAPIFYNSQATTSRDISLIIYRAMESKFHDNINLIDSLASLGARGLRVATEVPQVDTVFLNDFNPSAIELAKASAHLNGVSDKCSFSVSEACRFLIEHSAPNERFEIVDVDPFGSPVPYLDCALRAVKNEGMISITATDTAVLCGIYPNVASRKYFGYSLRTEYCHEIGIRLLLGALTHTAMKLDIGIHPIFSHSTRHYFRTYITIRSGASHGEESRKNLGYIFHCFSCNNRKVSSFFENNCNECGKKFKFAGPLWLGEIYDKNYLDFILKKYILNKRYEKMVKIAFDEVQMPPTYYVPDKIADFFQVITPSLKQIINCLHEIGFKASRTAINPKAFKTNAPIKIVQEVIKERLKKNVR